MDYFARAERRAAALARRLFKDGVEPVIIADALTVAGLGYYAAEGNREKAAVMLANYVAVRDGQ